MNAIFTRYIYRCGICLLLCIMFWCIAGRLVWMGVRHIHYASARMSQDENRYRDTLTITAATINANPDIVWVEEDEIKYKRRMFDIKRRIRKDEHLVLIGHYDEKDDELFRLLALLFEDDNGTGQEDVPIWQCEAIVGYPTIHIKLLKEVLLSPKTIFAEPCTPLHKPAAPFLPPNNTVA